MLDELFPAQDLYKQGTFERCIMLHNAAHLTLATKTEITPHSAKGCSEAFVGIGFQ